MHDQSEMANHAGTKISVWNPLRQRIFRILWIAAVASNMGTWMHDVGAAWLMTSLTASPLIVALMQTANTLPLFLLSLPAGALADLIDRRRLLLFTQGWMLAAAFILGILTLRGATTPWVLLLFTFLLGLGAALNAPAWGAIIPELVPRSDLPEAITLTSVSFNLARAVGPALGGLIVAAVGPWAVFLLNAASFLGVLAVLYSWHRTPHESVLPAERLAGAIRAGLRYVRHEPGLRAVLVRSAVFILCGSAIWALLPVLVRVELGYNAVDYGVILGSLGLGAVGGGVMLPKVQRRISIDWIVSGTTVFFAFTTISASYTTSFVMLCLAMAVGGVAWTMLLSSLNVAVQIAVPSWVRARAISVYLLVFFGFYAGGSALWGHVAKYVGIRPGLGFAALGLLAGLFAMWPFRLTSATDLNLEPSMHWPTPSVAEEPEPERGPVLVTVEYHIDPASAKDFTQEMRAMRRIRLRDGAMRWGLFSDAAAPNRYVEVYIVESWIEHLRQHERVTFADREIENRARAYHIGDSPPRVSHYLYAWDVE